MRYGRRATGDGRRATGDGRRATGDHLRFLIEDTAGSGQFTSRPQGVRERPGPWGLTGPGVCARIPMPWRHARSAARWMPALRRPAAAPAWRERAASWEWRPRAKRARSGTVRARRPQGMARRRGRGDAPRRMPGQNCTRMGAVYSNRARALPTGTRGDGNPGRTRPYGRLCRPLGTRQATKRAHLGRERPWHTYTAPILVQSAGAFLQTHRCGTARIVAPAPPHEAPARRNDASFRHSQHTRHGGPRA